MLANAAPPDSLVSAVHWLYYTIDTELLMKEIIDSTTRISTLLEAAKQYSQMDRSPHQTADLRDLLNSTLVMLAGKIPPGVTVVKEYDESLPPVPSYPAELNQVWTNLIDNAVQAMGDEGRLTIRTRRDDEFATVQIEDTGPGIPAEVRDRIFEPFFTTKPIGHGTGLGLDIAWRIVVNKHRGYLKVASEPGSTTFTVRLPLEGTAGDRRDRSRGRHLAALAPAAAVRSVDPWTGAGRAAASGFRGAHSVWHYTRENARPFGVPG